MPRLGIAGWIAAIAGTLVLLCIPAIFYFEARDLREWPVHVTQAVATLVCVLSAIAFLSSRHAAAAPRIWAWLANAAILLGTLWILAWVLAFFFAMG